MNCAIFSQVNAFSLHRILRSTLLGLCLAGLSVLPVFALEKGGMPDLGQQDQTCLPTSTANLIVWFGTHGYPNLIVKGDSKDDGYLHTVHAIITATNARYDWGTRTDAITYGIQKYIQQAGYNCDVEYRGMDWGQVKFQEIVKDDEGEQYKQNRKKPAPFSQDWLQQNDDPNKGFILLLAYCKFDPDRGVFTSAINSGHAVTLVNVEPDMILIHDPAHDEDEPGRKILTPKILTGGTFLMPGYSAPVAGLMLLSGSRLEAPPEAGVMLTGAVCVTMHPADSPTPSTISPGAGSTGTVAGTGKDSSTSPSTPATPATPSTPSSSSTSVLMWLFDLFFKK